MRRFRSCKELMAKCNALRRGEAHRSAHIQQLDQYLRKLDEEIRHGSFSIVPLFCYMLQRTVGRIDKEEWIILEFQVWISPEPRCLHTATYWSKEAPSFWNSTFEWF